MARGLSNDLNAVQLSERREPKWTIEIFDLRSDTTIGVGDIVLGNALPTLVQPRDFTDDVIDVKINEVAGDFVGDGVASSSAVLTISDPNGLFDPVSGSSGRWLRQGNVVRVTEGDNQVAESEWVLTFTGLITGQPGQSRNRTTGTSVLSVQCYDRSSRFLKGKSTSRLFVQAETYLTLATDLAEDDLGLASGELNFPSFGSDVTAQRATQFVDENPLVSIANVMFIDGLIPKFDGDGKLGASSGVVDKAPSRVYSDDEILIRVERPILPLDGNNVVTVIGLDATPSKIVQEGQVIATASITAGYFAQDTNLEVFWSEDRTQQAQNTALVVRQSVNGGLLPIGGESYTETTQTEGGSLGGIITIESGFSLGLIAAITGAYIGASLIPDITLQPVPPATIGETIPVGRFAQAGVLQGILLIMSTIGHGEYEISGEPFEYVFQEIRAQARVLGLSSFEESEVRIENHLIDNQADADAIALRVLKRERAKQNKRQVVMLHDLLLEPNDVFETSSGALILINSISRTLSRAGDGTSTVDGFEVTSGVVV